MARREMDPDPEEIYDLLYRLGLSAVSTAFFYLAYAARLVSAQPQRLLAPAWLYPETARHYGTDPETVERGIRRLSLKAWQNAPELLSQMAGAALFSAPPPARFLSILAGACGGAAPHRGPLPLPWRRFQNPCFLRRRHLWRQKLPCGAMASLGAGARSGAMAGKLAPQCILHNSSQNVLGTAVNTGGFPLFGPHCGTMKTGAAPQGATLLSCYHFDCRGPPAVCQIAEAVGSRTAVSGLLQHRQYEMTPSLVKRGFTCHT